MINGIINVYKEQGFTSHDVVAKLRGILKQKKIGHTGTLDPDAVGVLPVCLGKATKLCDLLTDKNKTYEAVLQLGVNTDTQDSSGTVLEEFAVNVTEEQIRTVIEGFVGEYDQIPPMYSALKVNGKKLYELARAGIEVERQPRRVMIDAIEIKEIDLKNHQVCMTVACSKGTYIRTLCYDIGQKLGCGGCMNQLMRTKVSQFQIEDSLTLQQIEQLVQEEQLKSYIIAIEDMFPDCSKVFIKEEYCKFIWNGNSFPIEQVEHMTPEEFTNRVRVYDCKGQFVGLYEKASDNEYKPYKMFL